MLAPAHTAVHVPVRVQRARRGPRVCRGASRAPPETARALVPQGRQGGARPREPCFSRPGPSSQDELVEDVARDACQAPLAVSRGSSPWGPPQAPEVTPAVALGAECPECETGGGAGGVRALRGWRVADGHSPGRGAGQAPTSAQAQPSERQEQKNRETELTPASSAGPLGPGSSRAPAAELSELSHPRRPRPPPRPADRPHCLPGESRFPSDARDGGTDCVGGSGGSWQSPSVVLTLCHDFRSLDVLGPIPETRRVECGRPSAKAAQPRGPRAPSVSPQVVVSCFPPRLPGRPPPSSGRALSQPGGALSYREAARFSP